VVGAPRAKASSVVEAPGIEDASEITRSPETLSDSSEGGCLNRREAARTNKARDRFRDASGAPIPETRAADEALRAAIKASVDAGDWARVEALIAISRGRKSAHGRRHDETVRRRRAAESCRPPRRRGEADDAAPPQDCGCT